MSASQKSQPILNSIAPRSLVTDMEQALIFYTHLGFATTYHDEGFALVERDGVALHFNASDDKEPPDDHVLGWIRVTSIETLYQQYAPTGALQSPLTSRPGGTKEFILRDLNHNHLIFWERDPATSSYLGQPTLLSLSPRIPVGNMEQALTFYAHLGFAPTDQDGEFTIVGRDRISLHLHVAKGHRVCWISVTNIEALYQHYLPTGALQFPLTSQPWGMKEFVLCDPFRTLLLFGESTEESHV